MANIHEVFHCPETPNIASSCMVPASAPEGPGPRRERQGKSEPNGQAGCCPRHLACARLPHEAPRAEVPGLWLPMDSGAKVGLTCAL